MRSELLRQTILHGPARVVGLDNNETELFVLSQEYRNHDNVHFFLGDLRDRDGLINKCTGVDIVLHAAALKHVILRGESPRGAIFANILGTQNVIETA